MSVTGTESQTPTKITVLVSDIRGTSFPKVGPFKQSGKFYVQLSAGRTVRNTSVSIGENPRWNDVVAIDTTVSSSLVFRVYAKHSLSADKVIGHAAESIASLISQKDMLEVDFILSGANLVQGCRIHFRIKISNNAAEDVAKLAKQDLQEMNTSPMAVGHLETAEGLITSAISTADPWEPLLAKVGRLSSILDQIAEVHPYARMAWSILSVAHKAILAQKERDQCITDLVETMNDSISFVSEAEPLKKVEAHKPIIERLVQQVIECAYFIRDYARNKSFWTRTLKHSLTDVDSKIEDFSRKLEEFKACLQGQATIQTEILVLRILDDLADVAADIAANANLTEMQYAKGAGYNPEKGCLPGTRQDVINEIIDWVNLPDDDNVQRLFWLSGVAGSGKSAIAHSIARLFDEQKRLGSSFCFDSSRAAYRRPHHLFSTISLDMSHLDKRWKKSLANIVKDNHGLLNTESVQLQFESLLLKPSVNLATIGPIVIIIDALDESGDPAARKTILSTLSKRSQELPANFRIIVTSRPESDIDNALGHCPHVRCSRMENINRGSTHHDISIFVRSQLSEIPALDENWFTETRCQQLAERSESLFQWAATACLFIQGNGKSGLDPLEQLEIILSATSREHEGLDSLYHTVLERVCPTGETFQNRFRLVLGRVLAANEPLPISTLTELRSQDEHIKTTEFILQSLGSLFSGVTTQFEPVRPLHTSIRDFLTNEERSRRFYVDLTPHQNHLAFACFRVMKNGLRFNICELESSYLRNSDVPNLAARFSNNIPSHLDYSCQFWAIHLNASQFEDGILNYLKYFLYNQILFWLEVMSLKKTVNLVSQAMSYAIQWCQAYDEDAEVFMKDVRRFVATFASPISQSAPHIYLSALPFAPKHSRVSRRFLADYPGTLALKTGQLAYWPMLENVMEGHTRGVASLAFSPDGTRIVSGSDDHTIRLWDIETGVSIGPPFKGHDREVSSVAFSRDGTLVVSGSFDGTVRLWDPETGESIVDPILHDSSVSSVAFSPDRRHIASGSWGRVMRWVPQTSEAVGEPLDEHVGIVSSVCFSPDGTKLVSGSWDNTLVVWSTKTGKMIGNPLTGHTNRVLSAAFSPDGKRIVSGSSDQTIILWDTLTGEAIGSPFVGHTDSVASVSFFPDGRYIASGSWDKNVQLWDAKTGHPIGRPLEGHTDIICSVQFSPDGKRIASGSRDGTIRLWDAQSVILGHEKGSSVRLGDSPGDEEEKSIIPLSAGHSSNVVSVKFSPDGTLIASSSYDKTIRFWDSKTGEAVGPPLNGIAYSFSFSPNGKHIVSSYQDKTARIRDIHTGEAITPPLEGHTDSVYSVAYSSDGKYIASGSSDHTIRIWNAETGELVGSPFEGHTNIVNAVSFSPDGKCLASGSDDNTVTIWRVETGEVIGSPMEGHSHWVKAVVFSPDGRRVASSSQDRTIRIWDAESTTAVGSPLRRHTRSIFGLAFSPDGKYIVSGSNDMTVRVWDSETGASVFSPFAWHTGFVFAVAFSPDGRRIASGSWDRSIRVWDFEVAKNTDQDTKEITANFELESHMEHGWIMDSSSNLTFWVPHWYRAGLCWPQNTMVIHKDVVKLDLDGFVHGLAWHKCKV